MHDTQYSTITSKPNYKIIFCYKDFVNIRGGSRTAATSKMERCVIHQALHLGCCSSPRSASEHLVQYKKIEFKISLSEKEKIGKFLPRYLFFNEVVGY